MKRSVLLAGEGRNELGGWFDRPPYRERKPKPGVLEALLRKVKQDGWQVRESLAWKNLTRYRAQDPLSKEELNTRALWLFAKETDCDLIVFSRDRDGDEARQADIERGLEWLDNQARASGMSVVGAVVVECLEAWLLALGGSARTEELSLGKAQERWSERGGTDAMVNHIEVADVARVRADAHSLNKWLDRARDAFE